jgi:hypothetical protein
MIVTTMRRSLYIRAKLTIMGMSKLLALGALASTASGEHLNVP